MNCDQLRDWLFTEYLDGEADPKVQGVIDEHLSSCTSCERFAHELKENVSDPFQGAAEFQPPDEVWSKIKAEIAPPQPQIKLSPRLSFWDYLLGALNVRTLSVAVPVLAIAAFAVWIPMRGGAPLDLSASNYLRSTLGVDGSESLAGDFAEFSTDSFGSAIEEFLL